MASGSRSGNNDGNNESYHEDPFVVVENDPPNMYSHLMMLIEQMAKIDENIAMLLARPEQVHGQPNMGPQVVIEPRDNDRNSLYEKFQK